MQESCRNANDVSAISGNAVELVGYSESYSKAREEEVG